MDPLSLIISQIRFFNIKIIEEKIFFKIPLKIINKQLNMIIFIVQRIECQEY